MIKFGCSTEWWNRCCKSGVEKFKLKLLTYLLLRPKPFRYYERETDKKKTKKTWLAGNNLLFLQTNVFDPTAWVWTVVCKCFWVQPQTNTFSMSLRWGTIWRCSWPIIGRAGGLRLMVGCAREWGTQAQVELWSLTNSVKIITHKCLKECH